MNIKQGESWEETRERNGMNEPEFLAQEEKAFKELTPMNTNQEKKIPGTKDSVCNDCFDDGFKGAPCPHISVTNQESWKKEWEERFSLGTTIGRTADILAFIESTILPQARKEIWDAITGIEEGVSPALAEEIHHIIFGEQ